MKGKFSISPYIFKYPGPRCFLSAGKEKREKRKEERDDYFIAYSVWLLLLMMLIVMLIDIRIVRGEKKSLGPGKCLRQQY